MFLGNIYILVVYSMGYLSKSIRLQVYRIVSYAKLYILLQIWRGAAVEYKCSDAITVTFNVHPRNVFPGEEMEDNNGLEDNTVVQ